jgi:hypothetical protein
MLLVVVAAVQVGKDREVTSVLDRVALVVVALVEQELPEAMLLQILALVVVVVVMQIPLFMLVVLAVPVSSLSGTRSKEN